MILRLVKMEFRSEEIDNFMTYFYTIQSKIEAMPGLVSLKIYQDIDHPNIVFTHSIWLNSDFLNNYRKSDTFKIIWTNTKKLFATDANAWSLNLK